MIFILISPLIAMKVLTVMLKINELLKLSFAIALGAGVLLTFPLKAETLTIEDSLRAGMEISKILAAQRQAFVISRQGRGIATAKGDLSGNFSLSGSHINTDKKSASNQSSQDKQITGAITLSKQIYDFGEGAARLKSANTVIDRERAKYNQVEQQVILNIISAHLALIIAQKTYAVTQDNEQRLLAHTQAASIRLQAGTSTPTLLAEAEARLAKTISDKIQAEADLISAQEAYLSLTGLDNVDLRTALLPEAIMPLSLEQAEQKSRHTHPAILVAIAAEKQAGMEFDVLKKSLLPKVNFSVSAIQMDKDGTMGDQNELISRIEMSTPFLVTEGSRSTSRRYIASATKAKIELEETLRTIRLSARKAFREYEAAKAKLVAVEAELTAAKLVAEGSANEVELGVKTLLDQLDSEQTLSDTRLRLIQTRQSILVNGYKLLQSTGQLTPDLFLLGDVIPELDSLIDPSSRYPHLFPISSQ